VKNGKGGDWGPKLEIVSYPANGVEQCSATSILACSESGRGYMLYLLVVNTFIINCLLVMFMPLLFPTEFCHPFLPPL
jgi:hypothetical protein